MNLDTTMKTLPLSLLQDVEKWKQLRQKRSLRIRDDLLTPTEFLVAKLLASNVSRKTTADLLGISAHTVYAHCDSIHHRLRLTTNVAITHWAIHNGHVKPNEFLD